MVFQFSQPHSLSKQNSLGVSAVCESYIEIDSVADLSEIINHATENKYAVFVMGEGTNLVLHEQVPGLVIKPCIKGREILDENDKQIRLKIGAGENWHELVSWTLSQGYYGLENLALIPGSCGAAPVQNIGAYGVEISQFVEAIDYVDLVTRIPDRLNQYQCMFAYRDSIFKNDLESRALISHIELRLSKVPVANTDYPALSDYLKQHQLAATPESVFDAVCELRRSKLPDIKKIPNAGSFFKNPIIANQQYQSLLSLYPQLPGYPQLGADDENTDSPDIKVPAAWLIDYLGWKGKSRGGVGVHDKQALVIVNPGHESGARILKFGKRIALSVEKEFGIRLDIEPKIVGA